MHKGHFRKCEHERGKQKCTCALKRYAAAFGILCATLGAEWAYARLSGSLALFSDVGHVFTDCAALAVCFVVSVIAFRSASSGEEHVEKIGGMINAGLLGAIAAYVFIEAWRRFQCPLEVRSAFMMAGAVIGAAGNLLQWLVLKDVERHEHDAIHMSAVRHILSDLFQSIAVLAGGIVLCFVEWKRLDAVLSFALACLMLWWAVDLARKSMSPHH